MNASIKLTKQRALELHERMWSDMRLILGDCPSFNERKAFKRCWIALHKENIPEIKDLQCVHNNCFLCEWVIQEYTDGLGSPKCENLCPIDWSDLTNKLRNKKDFGCKGFPNTCMFGSSKNDYREAWQTESITDILNLPEKVKEN